MKYTTEQINHIIYNNRSYEGVVKNFMPKLELDELTVRGTMNVYELIVNKIRATNGSLWVSDGQAAIYPGEDTSTKLNAGLWWKSTGSYQYHWYYYTDSSLNTFRYSLPDKSKSIDWYLDKLVTPISDCAKS